MTCPHVWHSCMCVVCDTCACSVGTCVLARVPVRMGACVCCAYACVVCTMLVRECVACGCTCVCVCALAYARVGGGWGWEGGQPPVRHSRPPHHRKSFPRAQSPPGPGAISLLLRCRRAVRTPPCRENGISSPPEPCPCSSALAHQAPCVAQLASASASGPRAPPSRSAAVHCGSGGNSGTRTPVFKTQLSPS